MKSTMHSSNPPPRPNKRSLELSEPNDLGNSSEPNLSDDEMANAPGSPTPVPRRRKKPNPDMIIRRLRSFANTLTPRHLQERLEPNVMEQICELLSAVEFRYASLFERCVTTNALKRVIEFLSARDLAVCAQVNREWRGLAMNVAKKRYTRLRQTRKMDTSFYQNWTFDPDIDCVTWISQLRAKELEYHRQKEEINPNSPLGPALVDIPKQVPSVVSLFPLPIELSGCGYEPVNGIYYNTSISQTGYIFSKRDKKTDTAYLVHKLFSGPRPYWYLSECKKNQDPVQICHAQLCHLNDGEDEWANPRQCRMPRDSWNCFEERHNPPPKSRIRPDLGLSDKCINLLPQLVRPPDHVNMDDENDEKI